MQGILMKPPHLTIKDVTARAVDAPLTRPIKTSVGTIPSAPLVLIDIVTDQDIVGCAYIFGYTPLTLRPLVELIANLRNLLLEKPVSPVERMRDFDGAFRLLGRQGLLGMAISGLDMAMWDALGRAYAKPVCCLLGGDERPMLAYDSYGVIDPRRDIALLENSLEQGFTGIKIKIGNGDLQQDVNTVATVRQAIGADTRLMVDYNQSLSVPEAIRRIDRLAEYDLQWVEEPVAAEDLSGHAAVRRKSRVAIQTGENWWFPEDIARAISASASDFAMLDVMKIGGVTGWMRAAGQAGGSHLFIEASAHVLTVTPTAHWLEYLDVASAILREPVTVEQGRVSPRGPGLGLAWDTEAVSRYAL